jgi:hypothetical protein
MIESGSHAGAGFATPASSPTPHTTPAAPSSAQGSSPTGSSVAALASANGSKSVAHVGEARFVGPGVLAELLGEADAEGFLTVQLDSPGPGHRGRLGVMIEAAIEHALERRGACPPGVAASIGARRLTTIFWATTVAAETTSKIKAKANFMVSNVERKGQSARRFVRNGFSNFAAIHAFLPSDQPGLFCRGQKCEI